MVIEIKGYQCSACDYMSFNRQEVEFHETSLKDRTKPFLYEEGEGPLWLDLSYLRGRMSSDWIPSVRMVRIKERVRDEKTHENRYHVELLDDDPTDSDKGQGWSDKGQGWYGHAEHTILKEKPQLVNQPS